MKSEHQLMDISDAEKTEIMTNLANNLPVLRASVGITQEALAKYLGVTRQTIVNVEKGKSKLNWAMTITLIMFFTSSGAASIFLKATGILTKNILKAIPGIAAAIQIHSKKK